MIKFKSIDGFEHIVNQIHLLEISSTDSGIYSQTPPSGVMRHWVSVVGHPKDESYEISGAVYERLLSVLSIDDQLLDADLG